MSSAPLLPAPRTPADDTAAVPDRVRHLGWCLPGFCETLEHCASSEILHWSAPVVWRMTGDDADVLMRRGQYGVGGEVFYEVHFGHRAYPEDITLTFSEDDVHRLFTGVHELRDCT